uniref:Secreted protein n=1 Tax=Elaeophora elaphi TaxID=1147741 RepID=A0A0R3S390_9BILA
MQTVVIMETTMVMMAVAMEETLLAGMGLKSIGAFCCFERVALVVAKNSAFLLNVYFGVVRAFVYVYVCACRLMYMSCHRLMCVTLSVCRRNKHKLVEQQRLAEEWWRVHCHHTSVPWIMALHLEKEQ